MSDIGGAKRRREAPPPLVEVMDSSTSASPGTITFKQELVPGGGRVTWIVRAEQWVAIEVDLLRSLGQPVKIGSQARFNDPRGRVIYEVTAIREGVAVLHQVGGTAELLKAVTPPLLPF